VTQLDSASSKVVSQSPQDIVHFIEHLFCSAAAFLLHDLTPFSQDAGAEHAVS
jgi:hypothetical protein